MPYEFVSDSEKEISKAFDVLSLLPIVAKRKTFIISPEGRIAHIFQKVNVKSHGEDVLEMLKKLKSS